MEDVSPEYMQLYNSEQTEHFVKTGMTGGLGADGFSLDLINMPEGEVDGYLIPWAGGAGPVAARQRFEAWWSAPERLERARAEAKRFARSWDFYYRLAKMRGKGDEYLADNPWYEAP